MFLELLALIMLGWAGGVLLGLLPGIHPNVLVLFIIPLAAIGGLQAVAFVAALAVANVMTDVLPAILLAAPDAGNELAALPGQRLLHAGHGYDAVKIYVVAAYLSLLVCVAVLPLLAFMLSPLYATVSPFIWIILIVLLAWMIASEKRKLVALVACLLAALIGLALMRFPGSTLQLLFPVFSGLFGSSAILLQLRSGAAYPEQQAGSILVPRRSFLTSVIGGTGGGVLAGFLPGVGSSQIASFATVQKKDESFLATMGAMATANMLLSIMSLWLIEKSRSGAAVVLENILPAVGVNEVIVVVIAALIAASLSLPLTLALASRFSRLLHALPYHVIGKTVLVFLFVLVVVTTGLFGLAVFITCCSLGIYVNLSGVKRGLLMAVLIVPTILVLAP